MCRHENHAAAEHAIAFLSTAEDADDDLVQGRARPQEKAGMPRPDRDLHQGASLGHKTHTSGHAYIKTRNDPRMSSTMSQKDEMRGMGGPEATKPTTFQPGNRGEPGATSGTCVSTCLEAA
jgi:hypothetical protein